MTEGQTLFLILSLLYVVDCLIWLRKGTVLFSARWRRGWKASFAGGSLGSDRGSLALLNPLPPLGSSFLACWMPISISPDGVSAFTLHGFEGREASPRLQTCLRYEDISKATSEGNTLLVNGSLFAKCGSAAQANRLADLINRLAAEPPEKREKLIRRFLDSQFEEDEALDRLKSTSSIAARTRWLCNAFFVFLYIVTPAMSAVFGLIPLIIPVAAIMFITGVIISIRYSHGCKALFPTKSSDRLMNVVKMILCPVSAIRAADHLTLDALSSFHPMLVAHLLLGQKSKAFAREAMRALKYPIQADVDDSRALEIASWYTACELGACARFLESTNPTILDQVDAPPTWDGDSSAYCPRCRSQFAHCLDECPDCRGVKLLPQPGCISGDKLQ